MIKGELTSADIWDFVDFRDLLGITRATTLHDWDIHIEECAVYYKLNHYEGHFEIDIDRVVIDFEYSDLNDENRFKSSKHRTLDLSDWEIGITLQSKADDEYGGEIKRRSFGVYPYQMEIDKGQKLLIKFVVS
tara:strand:- start:9945 stop:10343 length:399 start_codon:yes stop_codon:yes gene_type:complete